MERKPHVAIAAATGLLLAVIAVLGIELSHIQAKARADAEAAFRDRAQSGAAVTAALFGAATAAVAEEIETKLGSSRVTRADLASVARRGNSRYMVLLGPDGSVLAAFGSASPQVRRHIRGDAGGHRERLAISPYFLSDVLEVAGRRVVEFTRRVPAEGGARILVTGVQPKTINVFLGGYLARVPVAEDGGAYVLDSDRTVVASAAADAKVGQPVPEDGLAKALDGSGSGSFGSDRFFASSPVAHSTWEVVRTAPSSVLFASVTGPSRVVPWVILAAFGLAGFAALALFARALRGSAQLGAANRLLECSNAALEGRAEELERSNADLDRALGKLSETKERYALAAAGANDGIWDWDLTTGRVYYAPRWKEIVGRGDDGVGDSPDEWLDRVHADDRERLKEAIDAHLSGRSDHLESEHRMRRPDGSYHWVLARGLVVRDHDGAPVRMAGSMSDIGDRKSAEERLLHDALHDSLTELPNRALFADRLSVALARADRNPEHRCAILFLDLDRFKLVNDTISHEVGDRLLVALAQRLRASIRPGDTVARLGGDEFTILLDDIRSPAEARQAAQRVLLTLAEPFRIANRELSVTASIGISISERGSRVPELMRNADIAMYQAKRVLKAPRVAVFDQSMYMQVAGKLRIETELRAAIDEERLRVFYQPVVDLGTGRISGMEALVRWPTDSPAVPPMEFVPVAEETGLIAPLGRLVLRAGCAQLADWRRRGLVTKGATISVNVSPRQFAESDLVRDVTEALRRSGLPGSALRLEITESASIEAPERMRQTLAELRLMNVRVALDDFGTGYSSLTFLHDFPGDTVKIDRSFISLMHERADHEETVRAIVSLAHNLSLEVVAEGVDAPAQLRMLRQMGCEYAQGFLFAQPLQARAAEELIEAWDPVRAATTGEPLDGGGSPSRARRPEASSDRSAPAEPRPRAAQA